MSGKAKQYKTYLDDRKNYIFLVAHLRTQYLLQDYAEKSSLLKFMTDHLTDSELKKVYNSTLKSLKRNNVNMTDQDFLNFIMTKEVKDAD